MLYPAEQAARGNTLHYGIFERFFKPRLYLLPSLVNIRIRPFHVASSATLHQSLNVKAPLSLKQRIFVRPATVSLALNAFPLCPSPHMPSPFLCLRHPPPTYALRQRMFVRRATFPSLQMRSPVAPLSPMRSPLAIPRRP
ncbi:hypothetical protein K523DRAFT_422064 [Schizophyllum commune Tattone D]|nr:hypothetical protein K523DRAFT_422064 [Schizophyllum commune Tattone D]